MGDVMRLDRLLVMLGEGTRTQVKDMVRAGRVTVCGVPARDSGMQVDAEHAQVRLDGRLLAYKAVRHVMLNKPAGLLTAARDRFSSAASSSPETKLPCRASSRVKICSFVVMASPPIDTDCSTGSRRRLTPEHPDEGCFQ